MADDQEKPSVITVPRSKRRKTVIPGWDLYSAPELQGNITVSVHMLAAPTKVALECMTYFAGDARGGFAPVRHTVEFAAGTYKTGQLCEFAMTRKRAIGILFLWREGEDPDKVKVAIYAKRAKPGTLDTHIAYLAREFRQAARALAK